MYETQDTPQDEDKDKQELQKIPDILALAASENAARVAWVQEQIANGMYTSSASRAWAGRDDIMSGAAQQFGLTLLESAQLVDQAALDLEAIGEEGRAKVLKRLLLLRLFDIRKLIRQAMTDGRKESTFKFEPQRHDERKFDRIPMKEKVYYGVDMTAIGRLIEVEKTIAELQGLKGPDDDDMALSISEELDGVVNEQRKRRTTTVSIAGKLKGGALGEAVTEDTMMRIAAAISEGAAAKSVKSKVVEQPDTDDEDEEDEEDKELGAG